jgi:phospholipid transport system substrate-binding protein
MRMNRKRTHLEPRRRVAIAVIFAALVLTVAWVGPATAGPVTSPTEVVERFHARLLSVMKNAQALKVAGRYARLSPSIRESFNLPLMIRIATGTSWRHADTAQRQALIGAFARMSIAVYAARFDGFSGESFKTLGEKPGPKKTILVKTHLMRPGDSPVSLGYLLKRRGDGWRIIDVVLDGGISELAVRYSEYRQILKQKGVNGLVSTLHAKAGKLVGDVR